MKILRTLNTWPDKKSICQWSLQKTPEVKKKFKEFECLKVFIYDFKRNNRISSRKFYLKRRPENPNIKYQNNFINKIIDLLRKGKHYHILNWDENGYSLVLKGFFDLVTSKCWSKFKAIIYKWQRANNSSGNYYCF